MTGGQKKQCDLVPLPHHQPEHKTLKKFVVTVYFTGPFFWRYFRELFRFSVYGMQGPVPGSKPGKGPAGRFLSAALLVGSRGDVRLDGEFLQEMGATA